jgi:signal transduction histidine kinase
MPKTICHLLLALALLLLFNAMTLQGQSQSSNTSQILAMLNNANELEKRSMYDSAQTILGKALQLSKNAKFIKGQLVAGDRLAEIKQSNGDIAAAKALDSVAMPLALQLRDTGLLIGFYNRQGIYQMQEGNNDAAQQNFDRALALGSTEANTLKTAETYSNLGSLNLALGNKEQAGKSFFSALKLYEQNNNLVGVGQTLSNIASLHYLLGQLPLAIEYQEKGIAVREKINDKKGLANANVNIGQLYMLAGNNAAALSHLQRSLQLAQEVNAPKLLANSFAALSVYYSRAKQYTEALSWQTKAINTFEQLDDKPMLSRLYVAAGGLANAISDSSATLDYYLKGLKLSKELGNKDNIANAYEKLTAFYTNRGNLKKALDYNKSYYAYRDSIAELSNTAKIAEIQTRYETEKKDKAISFLNIQHKIDQLQIEKQAVELAGNVLEAEKKKNEIELLSKTTQIQDLRIIQQDEELEKQLLKATNTNQQLLLVKSEKLLKEKQLSAQKNIRNILFTGLGLVSMLALLVINRFKLKKKIQQQNEMLAIRNNISQNLHDEIGSTLTSINILSNVSQKAIDSQPQQAREMLHEIAEQSKMIQQNMSDIVWSIRPENEKVEDLITRMREYAAQTLEQLNVSATVNAADELATKTLPMQYRKELLLIYKEAISNIVKHANATSVIVNLENTRNQVHLSIADNGTWKGSTSGTGTRSMKARAESLGGTLQILTLPTGTTVQATVPIP